MATHAFSATRVISSVEKVAPESPSWTAVDWLDRWGKLAGGARMDINNNLQLTPYLPEAGDMLGELIAERYGQAFDLVFQMKELMGPDPAVLAAYEVERIDKEWQENDVSEDDREAYEKAEKAWLDRADAAFNRMIEMPARTGRGMAAKVRVARSWGNSSGYERVLDQAIEWFERRA